jgi:hypothetical protein
MQSENAGHFSFCTRYYRSARQHCALDAFFFCQQRVFMQYVPSPGERNVIVIIVLRFSYRRGKGLAGRKILKPHAAYADRLAFIPTRIRSIPHVIP